MTDNQEILRRLADGVREMDEELTVMASHEALDNEINALTAINQGLVIGMNEAGQLYEEEEYFVPELLLCSDAMYAGLDVLSPHIQRVTAGNRYKVVIGVVEGDTHDIGKNLVKLMLEVADFEIYDLGRDVPAVDFISKVKEVGADIVCLSTLMSTTMDRMADVIELLKKEGLREQVLVMIGGGPISQAYANRIGADAYSENAIGAVKDAKRILSEKKVAV
ncbi:MAG: corrinoid protein [Syntrophomonadaceae bacterium]|nr:corrinoid protein [Syntrophomonadaceae bacterium]MDD3023695.1 corrinoid protein [Syntrophomonadaceae bacterium]